MEHGIGISVIFRNVDHTKYRLSIYSAWIMHATTKITEQEKSRVSLF